MAQKVMHHKHMIIPLIFTLITPAAYASVDLIAISSVSGNYEDLAIETAGALENGVAGNQLGGVGSGLAYAGGNVFVSVPDRGPNAASYNAGVDNTTSYINRFQTWNLSLSPSAPGATLPYTLTPFLTNTTLLSSNRPLYYGSGITFGLSSGAPALNDINRTNYFMGRSDNFDSTKLSTDPNNARFDPEGVRISNDGKNVFISDEYGPYVYQFNRKTGKRTKVFNLPAKFAVSNLNAFGDNEISGNTSGRVANKGMEGLAITPDGKTLVGIMQSPLIQDGGTSSANTRIVTIDISSGATHEYAYELTNIGTLAKPKYSTVSEILAINNTEFLVDERDGKGLGDNSTAVVKRIYKIDLVGAQEVSNLVGADLVGKAAPKTLLLDVVAALNTAGINSIDIPAKLEGIAFGPDIKINNTPKHTLFIANDNDFTATVTDTNHPSGIDNPNKFFVFAIDNSDLPNFVAQQMDEKK